MIWGLRAGDCFMKKMIFLILVIPTICLAQWFFCDECCKAKRDYEQCKLIHCSNDILAKEYASAAANGGRSALQICSDERCFDYQEKVESACRDYSLVKH